MSAAPITASAPGKLLLFGEHAVVYDRPCLVTAVDLRVRATVTRRDDATLVVDASHLAAPRTVALADLLDMRAYSTETAFVEAAVARFHEAFPFEGGLHVTTAGPRLSYGLGSSSAVTVATMAALGACFGRALAPRTLFDLCYAVVRDVQGKGSGVDVAAAIHGGTLRFWTGGAEIEPLPIARLPIVIGYSGAKVSTRRHIDAVAERRARHPGIVGGLFDLMQQIVEAAQPALRAGDWELVGELADLNQGLLDALGVSTPRLAALAFAARAAGAWGAKLSGAGGGDSMFALVADAQRAAVERAMAAAGGEVVRLATNAPGVRLENG